MEESDAAGSQEGQEGPVETHDKEVQNGGEGVGERERERVGEGRREKEGGEMD